MAIAAMKAALRDAKQFKNEMDAEVITMRSEVQNARDEVAAAAARLQGAEFEVKARHMITQRMVLTQKEMEEVVLKRCWLARYWGLATQHAQGGTHLIKLFRPFKRVSPCSRAVSIFVMFLDGIFPR